MRKLLIILVLVQLLPISLVSGQNMPADSLVFAERDYFYKKYKSVRDTMTINSWINLKRLSDNLQQVVKRDQQIIDALNSKISADSAIVANLNDVSSQYNELSLNESKLSKRVEADATSILYLKAALALLLFLCLILIFVLITRYSKLKKYREKSDHYEALVQEKQLQLESLEADLRKLKQREADFREELEKGMETYQERLRSLQERCHLLETENQQLKSNSTKKGNGKSVGDVLKLSESASGLELPDNTDELKHLVRSLYDERNSLMNLAGKLQIRIEEENEKYREIINKINLLTSDFIEE